MSYIQVHDVFILVLEFSDSQFLTLHLHLTVQADLKKKDGSLDHCPALGDFCNFEASHTGKNVADWLHKTHISLGCGASYIGTMLWMEPLMQESLLKDWKFSLKMIEYKKNVTEKCDPHKVNTSASQASRTSGHKYNLNPGCETSLTKLHTRLVSTERSGTCMKVIKLARMKYGRKKYPRIEFAVKTAWGSRHKEILYVLLKIN